MSALSVKLLNCRLFLNDCRNIKFWNPSCVKNKKCQEAEEQLTVTTENDGIRRILLNNSKKRNALSLCLLESLHSDLLHNNSNTELRAVIIAARGPVFSSGHDLKELTSETGREYHQKVFNKCSEVMLTIQHLPVPVIAEVRGLATAAGCQLVASCDIAVASENARFATPGVNIGLFCSTPAVALSRAVPNKIAMEMLFTGEPISAERALLHGLVSKVVDDDKLEDECMKIAKRICETSRSVTAVGKACFYSQLMMDREEAYRHASKTMIANLQMADAQEGIDAFIKKRRPKWYHTNKLFELDS